MRFSAVLFLIGLLHLGATALPHTSPGHELATHNRLSQRTNIVTGTPPELLRAMNDSPTSIEDTISPANQQKQIAIANFLSRVLPVVVARRSVVLGGIFGSLILIGIFALLALAMLYHHSLLPSPSWKRCMPRRRWAGSRKGKQRERR